MFNRRQEGGFTLVEMAFVTMLSGLLLSSAAHLYGNFLINKKNEVTVENMEDIRSALVDFYGITGRYPCPADPTLPPTDPNYGREQCRADPTQPGVGACPVNLFCSTLDSRDADGDGNPDPVLMGALPSVTLADNAIYADFDAYKGVDGYGNKYSYAVSELMTDADFTAANPANNQLGAIFLKDENGNDLLNPPGSAHYVFYSHGRDGVGGYTKNGDYLGDCTVNVMGNPQPPAPGFNVTGIRTEIENCDNNDSSFVKALRSEGDNFDYFDDYLYFNSSNVTVLWARSAFSPPTGETYLYNTNLGFVAVGDATYNDPQENLDINGDLMADTGAEADGGADGSFCDTFGVDCLQPEALGSATGMAKCGTGEVARAIGDNQLVCVPLFPSGAIDLSCPSGPPQQFVTAFSNLGNRVCAVP